ncbi:coiled-coil domain-containing protein 170 [Myripristis murdjan]|uniref:coiled-coil domain-containing protein 170 n=1 Tax=Myripristis murdjan TaxID=586833 RepID=UPI001175F547|nr:coiled-coil domain-containing protein 170 [Myripristis murdjan]
MEVTEKPDEMEQFHERDRLRMRVAVLEESVRSSEVECKAGRETLMRLVAELDQERRKAASSAAALDSLKAELDGMVLGRRSIDVEQRSLMERLEASKRVIEAARQESQCLEKQVEELNRKVRISQEEAQAAQGQLQMFLTDLAALLHIECGDIVLPTEKDILQKLEDFCNKVEARLSHVSEQLARQTELHSCALQRAQLAEQQVQDLRDRLQAVETELLTADMHRDGLHYSKQQYEQFLEQLSETMKVDSIAADLGYDMRMKLLLSRAEKLVKQEGTALVESKTLTYSLQRKLKLQKDRLESKELHTELLRKKVSELEEEKRSRSALAVERDDAHLEARKLQKKVERLQSELKAMKLSSTELKAQLSHTNELKLKVAEQSQTVQEQSKRLQELVEGKSKVEKTLSRVSSDLQSQQKAAREDQQQLSTLRLTLAQLSERERELVDFRMVVSRMLGLDATTLALPNYEIIKMLENLLHTHYHHHHLHHHLSRPWFCPAHQKPHLTQIQDFPSSSSLDASASRSAGPEEAVTISGN